LIDKKKKGSGPATVKRTGPSQADPKTSKAKEILKQKGNDSQEKSHNCFNEFEGSTKEMNRFRTKIFIHGYCKICKRRYTAIYKLESLNER